MQLIIKGRNMEVNDRLKEYVEKKLGKMDRYLPDIQEIRVELAEEKSRKSSEREVIQVTMRSNGTLLRAEERNADIYSAIDAVADKLHGQIARYKGKRRRKIDALRQPRSKPRSTNPSASPPRWRRNRKKVSLRDGLFEPNASPWRRWANRRQSTKWSSWHMTSSCSTTPAKPQ